MKMENPLSSLFLKALLLFALTGSGVAIGMADERAESPKPANQERSDESLPLSKQEALGRARWIHELMHGTLQVMHRDFFGDGGDGDEGFLSVPSQSLEDVFKEMARSWNVEIRWLGVNATKDDEHIPADSFEEAAATALKSGDEEFSAVEGDRFRFVGAITIRNECLKCHVPYRKSLEDRVAGLAISMPLMAQMKE